jgi:hypothetical protein
VSNYRVRQVLALGPMPDRQLRFLVALATWLPDDTRIVSVGFDTLIAETGNARNTVRQARRELEAARKVTSKRGDGRGHLTLWTVLCLPEKGVSDVDPLPGAERGSTSGQKGGQPERADLQGRDRGLDRRAKDTRAYGRKPPARGSNPLRTSKRKAAQVCEYDWPIADDGTCCSRHAHRARPT